MSQKPPEALSWGAAVKLWWAFTWRWPVFMLAPLIPLSILIALARPRPEAMQALISLVAWPCALLAQVAAFRMIFSAGILGTHYRIEEPEQ